MAACVGTCLYGATDLGSDSFAAWAFLCFSAAFLAFLNLENIDISGEAVDRGRRGTRIMWIGHKVCLFSARLNYAPGSRREFGLGHDNGMLIRRSQRQATSDKYSRFSELLST